MPLMEFDLVKIFAPAAHKEVGMSIALVILLVALVVVVRMLFAFREYRRWFKKAIAKLDETARDPCDFFASGKYEQLKEDLKHGSGDSSGGVVYELTHQWEEFTEHLTEDHYKDGKQAYHNHQRPNEYFNTKDGSIEPHFLSMNYHALPGYFVTIGLMLTFFSLAAVLITIDADNPATLNTQIGKALETASFKFIISISGLLSSLIVSVAYRRCHSKLSKIIKEFNTELDARFIFARSRDKEQLTALNQINENMANLKTDLSDKLEGSITKGFTGAQDSLSNLSNSVGSVGSELGTIVSSLKEFSASSAKTFEEAQAAFSGVTQTLVEQAGKLNEDLNSSVNKMTATMEECSTNMAKNIGDAQSAFTDATSGFIQKAADVNSQMTANFEAISNKLQANSQAINSEMQASHAALTESTKGVLDKAKEVSTHMSSSVTDMNNNLQSGAQAVAQSITSAQDQFAQAADNLMAKADAINTKMTSQVENMGDKLQAGSNAIARSMDEAQQALASAATSLVDASEKIKEGFGPNVEVLVSEIERSTGSLTEALSSIHNSFESTSKGMKESLEDLSQGFGEGVGGIVGQIDDTTSNIERFNEELASNISAAQSGYADASEAFSDGARMINDQLGGMANLADIINRLQDKLNHDQHFSLDEASLAQIKKLVISAEKCVDSSKQLQDKLALLIEQLGQSNSRSQRGSDPDK